MLTLTNPDIWEPQVHTDAMEGGDEDEEGGDVFLGRSAIDAASAVLRRCLLQRSSSAAGTAVVLDAQTASDAHSSVVSTWAPT